LIAERLPRVCRAGLLLLASAVSACAMFKNDEDTSATVSKRVVGMPVGQFFDTFGPARTRAEQPDGSVAYFWVSKTGAVTTGAAQLDDAVCTLKIFADKQGKIVSAEILLDDPDQYTSSRCGTLFKPAPKPK
jgi:hypothetical protein